MSHEADRRRRAVELNKAVRLLSPRGRFALPHGLDPSEHHMLNKENALTLSNDQAKRLFEAAIDPKGLLQTQRKCAQTRSATRVRRRTPNRAIGRSADGDGRQYRGPIALFVVTICSRSAARGQWSMCARRF